MNKDDQACLALGREVVRMIHDVRGSSGEAIGYARRRLTFPGGACYVFVAKDESLADFIDRAIAAQYDVADAVPPSTIV